MWEFFIVKYFLNKWKYCSKIIKGKLMSKLFLALYNFNFWQFCTCVQCIIFTPVVLSYILPTPIDLLFPAPSLSQCSRLILYVGSRSHAGSYIYCVCMIILTMLCPQRTVRHPPSLTVFSPLLFQRSLGVT